MSGADTNHDLQFCNSCHVNATYFSCPRNPFLLTTHPHAYNHDFILESPMSILSTDNDPLELPDYFLSPVETIACSQHALASRRLSLHDITEAYHILSMRIRRSSSTLTVGTRSYPALEPLRKNRVDVAAALRRDISRALHGSATRATEYSYSNLAEHAEESVSWESTAYNKSRATDLSTLCHYALRLLAEIFRLPALSSVFSGTFGSVA